MNARKWSRESRWVALLGAALAMAAGCSSRVSDTYGESENYAAKNSPGGMSVFRSMVEERGTTTYSVRSLSPSNMKRLDAIVWVPDMFPIHDPDTYRWLDKWLAQGGKTLVYIGRDYSPHESYWTEIARRYSSGPAERSKWLIAKQEAARAQSSLDALRQKSRDIAVMPWCVWDLQAGGMHRVESLAGPWSKFVDSENTSIMIRSAPRPIRSKEVNELKKRLDWQGDQSMGGTATTAVPKPGRGYEKVWSSLDTHLRDIAEALDAKKLPEWTVLLASSDNTPLVAQVPFDGYSESKIFIISNNSLFCNLSMLRPSHRDIAKRVIDEFGYGGVGFVTGDADPVIREDDRAEQQRGFEMLTVWPLNVVTIHAAFLGIAAIIAAFPIFGHPKKLRAPSNADFGLHVEAVGQMMQRSGDTAYAMRQISEYFRSVRGDSASPWANMGNTETDPGSPFRGSPKE